MPIVGKYGDQLLLTVLASEQTNAELAIRTCIAVTKCGGIVMSPHRARMTDKTLTSIVFLKCNARGGITNSALQKNK